MTRLYMCRQYRFPNCCIQYMQMMYLFHQRHQYNSPYMFGWRQKQFLRLHVNYLIPLMYSYDCMIVLMFD